MATSIALLGPPEIRLPTPSSPPENPLPTLETPLPTPQAPTSCGDAFMNLMISDFNKKPSPPKGLTENLSPTFLSTGNPCLDFFFHVVPDTPPENLTHLLESAWKHDPLTTLKLVCNLRGVRGTGKSDKKGFYTAAAWLHKNHPKTLVSNVRWFADFGYFKDFPQILFRLVGGIESGKQKPEAKGWNSSRNTKLGKRKHRCTGSKSKSEIPREERIADEAKAAEIRKEKAKEARNQKTIELAKTAVEKYNADQDYKCLYDRISETFAELLISDMEFLKSNEGFKISLAAKWCPSLDSSFDRSTLLCESIGKRIFPREKNPEYEGIEEAHYGYRVRDRLRKEVLVPLRKALELPEIYMSSNEWHSLPYNRVASVAMKNYKKIFFKHDEERFNKYIEDVKSGKAKIAAGALLPHEIVSGLDELGDVAELQWKRMVEDLSKKGKLNNCLAVCDVSGSMSGIPMEVSVALGLLVSELSEDPWKGKVITFSDDPQLHLIQGEDLLSKTKFIREMDWGMNTDFQKVFDQILKVAVDGKLKEEKMVKRIFVFSDMEFDQASATSWETDYEAIQRKFEENGYGKAVPEIVFWNLRDSKATPVLSDQKGVAMVSGFSKNLLNLFLNGDGIVGPSDVMEMAIAGPEYQKLVVVD